MPPSLAVLLRLGEPDGPRLSAKAYRVLFWLLCWRHGHRRAQRWPMQDEIARSTGFALSSVKRACSELKAHRVLRSNREQPRGRNMYGFNRTHEWKRCTRRENVK